MDEKTSSPGTGRQDRKKFGARLRDMVGGARLSEDEIAIKALQAYNNEAKDPRVYNKIRDYAGGTIYLLEFTNPSGGQSIGLFLYAVEKIKYYMTMKWRFVKQLCGAERYRRSALAVLLRHLLASRWLEFSYTMQYMMGITLRNLLTMRCRLCLAFGSGNRYRAQPASASPPSSWT
jgi:hypothetical protein